MRKVTAVSSRQGDGEVRTTYRVEGEGFSSVEVPRSAIDHC